MANSEDVIVPADLEDDVAGSASALRVSPWAGHPSKGPFRLFVSPLASNPLSPPAVPVHSRYALHYRIAMHVRTGGAVVDGGVGGWVGGWRGRGGRRWVGRYNKVLIVVPMAVATSLDIALSSFSLALVTRTFYSMWRVVLPVAGETEFELLGFILVMLASFTAGLRWVLLQVLLQPQLHSACVLCLLSHTPQSSGFSPFLAYLLWSRHPHATISFPVLLVPLASHQPQVRPPSTPTGLTNLLLTLLQYLAPVMALVCGIFSLLHEPWSSLASLPYFDTWPHALWTLAVMPVGGVLAFCMVGGCCRATRHVSLKAIGCTRSLTTRGQALGPTLAVF
ncbi:unnamed protein product [Closterium sp. NIES-65]|nr:unnamed protein product [Closterium sp. NIES-65]